MTENNKSSSYTQPEEPSLVDAFYKYLYIALKYKILIIIITVIITPTAFYFLKKKEPVFVPMYKASARIRVIAEAGVFPRTFDLAKDSSKMETKRLMDVINFMNSTLVLEEVAKEVYGIDPDNKSAIEDSVKALRSTTKQKGKLSLNAEFNYITIKVIENSGEKCFAIINSLIRHTKAEMLAVYKQIIEEIFSSLEERLEKTRSDLEEAKLKFSQYILKNETISKFFETRQDLLDKNAGYSTDDLAIELVKMRTRTLKQEEFLSNLENVKNEHGHIALYATIIQYGKYLTMGNLLPAYTEASAKLKDLLRINKEAHPDVIEARKAVAEQENLITIAGDAAIKQQKLLIEREKSRAGDLSTLLEQGIGNVMVEYNQLKRNINTKQRLANKVLDSIQQINLANRAMNSSSYFVIIDPPELPTEPYNLYQKTRTRTNFILFAVILGLGAGISAAAVIDYFSMTIRDIAEIEGYVDFHILGEIPMHGKKGKKVVKKYSLLLEEEPASVVSEAFRGLRTNIKFRTIDSQIKTLLITSLVPMEGKTFIAANLATAFAQTNKKVLVIDCDLRKSTLYKYFNINNNEGMVQLAEGNIDIKPISKIMPNLFIVPAGKHPQNPSELLSSENFDNALSKLKDEFDLIIIDSPPLFAVTDATILLRKDMVDGSIIILRANVTPKKALKRLAKMSADIKDKTVGVVFNGIDVQKGKYGSYYYYHYDYYGKKQQKKA